MTCFPASAATMAGAAWWTDGVTTSTASTAGSFTNSSTLVYALTPCSDATFSARSGMTSHTATSSALSLVVYLAAWPDPLPPVPTTATPIFAICNSSWGTQPRARGAGSPSISGPTSASAPGA